MTMTDGQAATDGIIIPPPMVTEEMITERDWGRGQVPAYRVSTVALVFFGMSEAWLRLKLRATPDHPLTWFIKDGQEMVIRRKNPANDKSERVFLLSDIEWMALSLFRLGSISAIRYAKILRVVEAQAYLYGLIGPDAGEDDEE